MNPCWPATHSDIQKNDCHVHGLRMTLRKEIHWIIYPDPTNLDEQLRGSIVQSYKFQSGGSRSDYYLCEQNPRLLIIMRMYSRIVQGRETKE